MFRKLLLSVYSVLVLAQLAGAALYPIAGGTVINFAEWSSENYESQLSQGIALLGPGTISKIWVSPFGTLSYKRLKQTSLQLMSNNVLLAPLFRVSQQGPSGQVIVREVVDDSALLNNISLDINSGSFYPSYALIVTWSKVSSVSDSSLTNSFQIVLTTDGRSTYAIYNYGKLGWGTPDEIYSSAGIFAFGDKLESCIWNLFAPNSNTIRVSKFPLKAGDSGKVAVDITNPLQCTTFDSPCGSLQLLDRGFYQRLFANTGSSEFGWEFYAQFTCQPGFALAPNVTTQEIRCKYESDYYEYAWELVTKKCIDLEATKRFEATLRLDNTTTVQWSNDDGKVSVTFKNQVEEMIVKLLHNAGLSEVSANVNEISNVTESPDSTGNETQVAVNFTAFVPSYVSKINTTMLKDKLSEGTEQGRSAVVFQKDAIEVKETTDECLQACLCRVHHDPVTCRGKKLPELPPDACCGICGKRAKAYASSVKACCGNRHLYNPTKSVCCNGQVRKGKVCPNLL